jgi:hypothetical protein
MIDFDVSNQLLIVYFVVMFLLGLFAITLMLKTNSNYDRTAFWYQVIFNVWSLFIGPLILSISDYSSAIEVIGNTLSGIMILSLLSGISMSFLLLIYIVIFHHDMKKKDDPSWFSISLFWILGVLIGAPVFYFIYIS